MTTKAMQAILDQEIILGGLKVTRRYALRKYIEKGASQKFLDWWVWGTGVVHSLDNHLQVSVNEVANELPEGWTL